VRQCAASGLLRHFAAGRRILPLQRFWEPFE